MKKAPSFGASGSWNAGTWRAAVACVFSCIFFQAQLFPYVWLSNDTCQPLFTGKCCELLNSDAWTYGPGTLL